jgi:hypothetical protein
VIVSKWSEVLDSCRPSNWVILRCFFKLYFLALGWNLFEFTAVARLSPKSQVPSGVCEKYLIIIRCSYGF